MSIMDCVNVKQKNADFGVYSFFEKVLINYVPLLAFDKEGNISNKEGIKAYEADKETFMALIQNYEYSKGTLINELGSDDEIAHAFTWYMADRTIVLKAGEFYINPEMLFQKLNEYNKHKEHVEALNSSSFADGESEPGIPGIQYTIK